MSPATAGLRSIAPIRITVFFIPRDYADSPMEVKQYVDGRLEGDIDELLIADRALEPQEIVRLMSSNRLVD